MNSQYKHVRFDYGLLGGLDRRVFDERLVAVLDEQAAQGWELKGSFHDFGWHVHLLFSRLPQEE